MRVDWDLTPSQGHQVSQGSNQLPGNPKSTVACRGGYKPALTTGDMIDKGLDNTWRVATAFSTRSFACRAYQAIPLL